MRPINTSIYDFPTLRDPKRGYIYVDKTRPLYEIAKPTADCIYYLPRPRRFGKSLMISTLKALFEGRRELFRGLAIEQTDWDWANEVYPVLHLDMSQVVAKTDVALELNLQELIRAHCEAFGIRFAENVPVQASFAGLLRGLAAKSPNGKYVMLVDEYDAPISGLLDTPEGRVELRSVRQTLHDFYMQAKAECGNMRFLMVTGVSRFAKTSIFSVFNNPKDLMLDARAADLLGYTHEEMEKYFHEYIQAFADRLGIGYREMFDRLLDWYDGYQFSPDRLVKVVNPVSLGNALSGCRFDNYWGATAGSTLIFDALKAKNKSPVDFAAVVTSQTLGAADALTAPTVALLYQGGCLTIDRRLDDETFSLRIPNLEVARSLERGYMRAILGNDFELDDFQRRARNYAAPDIADARQVWYVALNYNDATRTLDDPLCEVA